MESVMFFEPLVFIKEKKVTISKNATVTGVSYASKLIKKLISERGVENGDIETITLNRCLPEDLTVEAGEETYALIITDTDAFPFQYDKINLRTTPCGKKRVKL